MDGYVVVGALARVDQDCRHEVCSRIETLEGFSTFAVEDPLKVGVLIEASSLDEAHMRFTDQLTAVEGVLGAWPVSVESDEGFDNEESSNAPASSAQESAPVIAPESSLQQGPSQEIHTPSFKSEAIR